MSDTIQLRRGNAATWTANNPILAQGEAGLEMDTGKLKFGDGTSEWVDLPYFLVPEIVTVTLFSEEWDSVNQQTCALVGLSATSKIRVYAALPFSNTEAAADAFIVAISVDTDTVTFECDETSTIDIDMIVEIIQK